MLVEVRRPAKDATVVWPSEELSQKVIKTDIVRSTRRRQLKKLTDSLQCKAVRRILRAKPPLEG